MDRKSQVGLKSILRKISSKELLSAEAQHNKLMYSVIGFMPACDFVDNAMLISNLGYLLSQKGLNTCILDMKVFYPNLYQYLDVEPHTKGNGFIKVLKSDNIDIRNEIQQTKYKKLFLLSPSPQDLFEEYFEFDFEQIDRVITTLKQTFDIVLIDIPNNPPLEFCLGAMKNCHAGFFTATERIEVTTNMIKLLDYANSVGISTAKFTSVIFMNLQDIEFDYQVVKDSGFQIAAALPLVKSAVAEANEGKLYLKDTPILNKYFVKEIHRVADWLAEQ